MYAHKELYKKNNNAFGPFAPKNKTNFIFNLN